MGTIGTADVSGTGGFDRASRRTTRKESRRRQILDAAAEEFAERGYEGATLDRIGERVGLSKASLYYYVSSKEQLFAGILAQFVDGVTERVAAAEQAGGDAEAVMAALAMGHLALAGTPQGRALTTNPHALRRGAPRDQADRYEDLVAGVIQRGIESGRIRPVVLRPAVKLVIGAMNGVSQWFHPSGNLSVDEVVDGVVGVLLHGVASDTTLRGGPAVP